MKLLKLLAVLSIITLMLTFVACGEIETASDYGMPENASHTESLFEMPEIVSLDKKMANYLDISLFDEENYANIYLGKKYKYDVAYDEKALNVPTTLQELNKIGFTIAEGSEYDGESYIYAKETITLNFVDEKTKITTVFYNSSNSSIRLKKCKIAKIRIENNQNTPTFNVNGIHNNSTVTDVIDILGTPSHFYAIDDDNYYFDYFLHKSDRRNKIRVFVDLINDCVTAIEFSYYK